DPHGAAYDPKTNTWSAMAPSPPREDPISVWAGDRMIVWAGARCIDPGSWSLSGEVYDPGTDAWTPMATSGAPLGQFPDSQSTGVWTGSRMMVWGGSDGTTTEGGGFYDPASNTWASFQKPTPQWAGQPRYAVWTGSRVFVIAAHQFATLFDP